MNRTLFALVPMALLSVAAAHPATASHEVSTSHFQEVLADCGPGDELVADFTIRERYAVKAGRDQLHLRLIGTITRTGTGVVGRYSETQLDKFVADGSEVYSGKLTHLVVPGAGVIRAAGHAVFPADGEPRFTPGLAALSSDDFVDNICDLLA